MDDNRDNSLPVNTVWLAKNKLSMYTIVAEKTLQKSQIVP